MLGVVGLIIGGIWVAAAAIAEKQRRSRMDTALVMMVDGARALFNSAPLMGVSQDVAPALIAAGVVPQDMIANSVPVSPFGSFQMQFLVRSQGYNQNVLTIDFPVYSRADCMYYATRFNNGRWRSYNMTGNIWVAGTMVAADTFTIDSALLSSSTFCGKTAAQFASGGYSAAFDFYLK